MATSLRTAEDEEIVNSKPLAPLSPSDLDNLMMILEVEFVKLAECVVSPGWRLEMAASDAPGIHYDPIGMGRTIVGNHPPIDLQPHTLIFVPAGRSFCIEIAVDRHRLAYLGRCRAVAVVAVIDNVNKGRQGSSQLFSDNSEDYECNVGRDWLPPNTKRSSQ